MRPKIPCDFKNQFPEHVTGCYMQTITIKENDGPHGW